MTRWRNRSNSFGDSLTSWPPRGDVAADQIDRQVARDKDRQLALRLKGVTQRGAQSRHQLGHAEGLADIIVGAEVERLDLDRSSWRADSTTIGTADVLRISPISSSPLLSGRPRSRITRSGFSAANERMAPAASSASTIR